MTALAAGAQRPEISTPTLNSAPQKGNTIVYQGSLIMVDTSGFVRPAAAGIAGAFCCGVTGPNSFDLDRYDSTVVGFTADGSLTVRYREGSFGFLNDGGSPILATTQPGTILYAVDDQTVSLSSSGGTRPVAGRLRALDATSIGGPVLVDVSKLIGKAAAEELSGGLPGTVDYVDLAADVHGAFQTRAGAGAISLSAGRQVKMTSAAVGAVVTLANGVTGQRLSVVLTGLTTPGSHTAVLTPTNGGPWTFDTVGDTMEIEFDGTNWVAVSDCRAVTRPGALRILSGLGRNNVGQTALVGAKVGDKVISVQDITTHLIASASFEAVITVADQIQQSSAANLSADTIMVFLRPLS